MICIKTYSKACRALSTVHFNERNGTPVGSLEDLLCCLFWKLYYYIIYISFVTPSQCNLILFRAVFSCFAPHFIRVGWCPSPISTCNFSLVLSKGVYFQIYRRFYMQECHLANWSSSIISTLWMAACQISSWIVW